jgi:hypothetical protein
MIIGLVPEDLWKYFDPDFVLEYKKPELSIIEDI